MRRKFNKMNISQMEKQTTGMVIPAKAGIQRILILFYPAFGGTASTGMMNMCEG
jgi:hypothetical protein